MLKIFSLGLIALIGIVLLLNACSTTNIRLQPSQDVAGFNADNYENFSDYLTQTREQLR